MLSMMILTCYMYQYIDTIMGASIQVGLSVGWTHAVRVSAKERKHNYARLGFPSFSYGTHRSVNIPWPEKGMGDAEYLHAFLKVVMPIAMEFAPELVISE